MDTNQVLNIVKARLGISHDVRDTYITAIINGVIDDLEKQMGITLSPDNNEHIMFVADFVTWRYQSRDEAGGIPRHLQFRLHNLYVHSGGDGE